jgi:hypothetical protein
LEGAPKKIDPSTIRVPPKRGEGYQTSKSRAMQRQELIAFLKANSDRLCKDLELGEEAKDYIKELMKWQRFVPNTRCSTVLERLGVSGDDAEEVGVEEDSGDITSSSSAYNLIALLQKNPDGRCGDLELGKAAKEDIKKIMKWPRFVPNTRCSTVLERLGVVSAEETILPLSGGGGSLLSVDDSGDTMSQASSPSQGTRHEPSPQTGGLLGSWFCRGQSANTSQYLDDDPPPGAFEDMRGPGDDDASEPVMKKSEVDRIIEWAKQAIDHMVKENRRLANTNASMQEHITQLEMRAAKPQQYVVNADGAIADLVQYFNHA